MIPVSMFRMASYQKTLQEISVYMSKEDLKALLKPSTDQVIKDICLWSVLTGCRVSETLNRTWNDIDVGKTLMHIRSGETLTTKSDKDRVIPIQADF